MKKLLLLFVMMLTATVAAWADYTVVDGVRYEIVTYTSPEQAYVVAPESGVYTGAVTIPATINYEGNDYAVTQISSGAFENSTITSLTLPVGLQYIFSSFTGTSLNSLTIPGTVSFLGSMGDCTSLTSITFAYDGIDGITDEYYWSYGQGAIELGYGCFTGCTNLTEINVDRPLYRGSGYDAIFAKATKATFGPHATNIPAYCFYWVSLEQLTIGANVTEIETNAFKQACLPAGYAFPFNQIKKIGTEAFYECKNLPAAVDLSAAEEIGDQAFIFCTDIQSLTIGTCNLSSGAFSYCTNLSSLTLAEGLTDTGDSNFQYLDGLTTVTFPSTLKRIGWGAFQNCPNLTIPDGLPAGLEEISGMAFNQCAKVNVTLPSSLKIIDQNAFSNTGMESVTIPTSLTDLGDQAFSYCEKLKTVSIPYAETPINLSYTFWNCTNVESITIDRSFTIPESTTAFSGSVDKTEVVIGPHVTTLPPYAFYEASFKSVTLSVNLASISKFAFLGTTVPSLTLPNACTEIAYRAFDGSYIDNLYVPYLTPIALPTEDIVVLFNYSNTKLWVPGGTMALYQAADGWKLFENMDYWSYVVTSDVAGKGTVAIANGEAVTDNGTNTEKSVTGANLVEAGAGTPVSGLFVREKDVTLTPTPARGYELSALTANDADIKAATKVTNLLADQTIHTTFTPIIYNITYDLKGGAVATANPATYTVEDAAITLVNPTRTGYNFKGWTGTDLEGAVMTVTIPASSIGNREFTATWEPIVYDITYDLAGGAVDPANKDKYTIETPDFTLTNPTKTGYTFTGWTGTGLDGKTMTVTVTTGHWGDRSYTATWEPNPYKVHFDANGGDGGTMADQNFVYDTAQNLTENAFTRTGYTFTGWNSKADGTGTPYADKAEVVNLTATRDAVVTMYAQWQPITYYVSFDKNGGTGTDMIVQKFVYDTAQPLSENAYTRKGYNFDGWNSKANGSGTPYTDKQSVKNLSATQDEVVTLYAQWQIITFTIGYDLAGGTVATPNPTEYTVETATFTLTNPTRKGYNFDGWTGTGLSTPTKTVTIEKGSIENRTYTANWTPINYTITYDLAGGEVATANPEEYTIETAAFTLNNPTRTGYTFKGWTGTGLDGATMTVTIAKGSTGNREYTATWERNAITLVDDADNSDLLTTWNGIVADVTLSGRTFSKNNQWNTICLPFDLTIAGSVLDGAEVRTLENSSLSELNLTLTFSDPVTEIVAGKPYVIRWTSGEPLVNPKFVGVTVNNVQSSVMTGDVEFIGTYAPTALTKDDVTNLYLGSNNTLYYPNVDGFKVNAFRAYFKVSDSLGAMGFNIIADFGDGSTTRIQNIESTGSAADSWYTLNGVKLNGKPTQKGVFIHNGKKEIVK